MGCWVITPFHWFEQFEKNMSIQKKVGNLWEMLALLSPFTTPHVGTSLSLGPCAALIGVPVTAQTSWKASSALSMWLWGDSYFLLGVLSGDCY